MARQRQATRPGLAVRGTFSPARAWRPAVVARLARTLGIGGAPSSAIAISTEIGNAMEILHRFMKWVMLVSGLLTCTMFYAAVAPEEFLRSNFGQSIEGPVAQIVVRNWGILVGLMGILLIYGAFQESARRIALFTAGTSKGAFIALILSLGQQFLQFQVGIAVAVDSAMVLLFAAYLVTTRGKPLPNPSIERTSPGKPGATSPLK